MLFLNMAYHVTKGGSENYDVIWWMFNHPLTSQGHVSFIAGKSSHNQRIERLWVDIFHRCTLVHYEFFHYLLDNGFLDRNGSLHIYTLSFVLLPRMNSHLELFIDSWNEYPMRTEGNMTPTQKWIHGSVLFNHSNDDVSPDFGIDWTGTLLSRTNSGYENGVIEISEVRYHATEVEEQYLTENVQQYPLLLVTISAVIYSLLLLKKLIRSKKELYEENRAFQ